MKETFKETLDKLPILTFKREHTEGTNHQYHYVLNTNMDVRINYVATENIEYVAVSYMPKDKQAVRYSFNYYGILPKLAFRLNMPREFNELMKYIGPKMKYLKRNKFFIK